MTPWFRLTLICCVLLCLFLGLTQAVDWNYQPVVSSGSPLDQRTQATCDSPPSSVVGTMVFDLARARLFGSLVLDCGLTVDNIGPPGQENHGPPEPMDLGKLPARVGNSNQRHRATLSKTLLVFSQKIERSEFCISL